LLYVTSTDRLQKPTGVGAPAEVLEKTATMSTTHTPENASIDVQPNDLSDREVRALTEPMVTLDDVGPVKDSPGLYEVTSTSTYIVDMDTNDGPHCTCKDHEYRGVDCAHIERVRFATCRKPIPSYVDEGALDDQLGEHITEGQPRVAMADGGLVARQSDADTEPTSTDPRDAYIPIGVDTKGGHHVYRTTDETVFAIEGGRVTQRYDVSERSVNDWIDYVADRRGWESQELHKTAADALGGAL